MLAIIPSLIVLTQSNSHWYGPATATFNTTVSGNPYDPAENDLRVWFKSATGETYEWIAFLSGDGSIKAILVAPKPGDYQATLIRNGKPIDIKPAEGSLHVQKPLSYGYIHVDQRNRNRFIWDDGSPFYPVGFNLGWQNWSILDITAQLKKMGANGVNWSRIWAAHFDSKNPWWPQGDPTSPRTYLWRQALTRWQEIFDAADQAGVAFQMVLFHHGAYSTGSDPNWKDNPWNKRNGGFLDDASQFFTNQEAIRRTKMWLRYAVARYGASPSVFAWELFNEVEQVDAAEKGNWDVVTAWHKQMADYIRSIDPYHHMITTSSAIDQTALWSSMDYYQKHIYPPDVLSIVLGQKFPTDKPAFFGEIGPNSQSGPSLKSGIRDLIYGSILSNRPATGMSWNWELVEQQNLYPIYKIAHQVIDLSQIASHPNAKMESVKVLTEGQSDLSFGPGLDWHKPTTFDVNVPDGPIESAMAGLSMYFQSEVAGHKEWGGPVNFHVKARNAGRMKLSILGASSSGGRLHFTVNGVIALEKLIEANSKPLEISFDFPAGTSEIVMHNIGDDWILLGPFTFTGLAPSVRALELRDGQWSLLRLTALPGVSVPTKVGLQKTGLADGNYSWKATDLESGSLTTGTTTIRGGELKGFVQTCPDLILMLSKLQ